MEVSIGSSYQKQSRFGARVSILDFQNCVTKCCCFGFWSRTDIIFIKDEDVVSPANDVTYGLLCFYDVLADYFVRVPKSGKPILDLIVQQWSQSFASNIFALLFHKWVRKHAILYLYR